MHAPYHWRERACEMLLIPLWHQVTRLLDAWAACEGGTAENNPLNTTYRMPGATPLTNNPDGVKNYPNAVVGISATACTIAQNPTYAPLWRDMQGGKFSAEDMVERNRDAFLAWGTPPDNILNKLKEIA